MEGYGTFSEDSQEYIIDRPDPPRPWSNLLINANYRVELSHNGQAKLSLGTTGCIETYRNIYFRDNDTGQFWALNRHPVGEKFDFYQCRHGLGQTKFILTSNQVNATATVFVPKDFDGEIWHLNLHNTLPSKRRLSIFFATGLPPMVTEAGPENNRSGLNKLLVGRNRHDQSINYYLGSDHNIDSFDCNQEIFLGSDGNLAAPKVVVEGKGNRSSASGEPALLATQHNFSLGKNTPVEISFFVGATSNLAKLKKQITTFRQLGETDKTREESRQYWRDVLGGTVVYTGESNFDQLFNYWWKYQAATVFSPDNRTIQSYSSASSALWPPDKENLTARVSRQAKDGQFDSLEKTLDLIQQLINYATETGDLNFFNQSAVFEDGGDGTILRHFIRGLNFCQSKLSAKGLMSVNAPGNNVLEVAALTGRFAHIIGQSQPILESFNEHYLVSANQKLLEKLVGAVDRHLRIGRHYLTGIHSEIGRIGLKKRPRQIDASAQAWLIIGGLISPERAKSALRVVDQNLGTAFGTVNFSPSYPTAALDGFNESADSPGARRNGAIVTETVAELMWAKSLLGQGNAAYRLWQQIDPLERSKHPAVYGGEPYLVADRVFGPIHPRFGRGEGGWGSFGVSQLWSVMLEQVLGIKPVLTGLQINPCIPKDWRQVEISRRFRGADYHFRIHNPFRVSQGIDRIIVDGVRLTGNVIQPFAGGNHFIEVTLG